MDEGSQISAGPASGKNDDDDFAPNAKRSKSSADAPAPVSIPTTCSTADEVVDVDPKELAQATTADKLPQECEWERLD